MQNQSGTSGRIRASRRDDVRSQLERRLIRLGLGRDWTTAGADSPLAQRLARALRRERRAAGAGIGGGYDPLRHLVLARLARLLRRAGCRRGLGEIICGGRAAGQGPSSLRAPSGSRRSSARPSDSRRAGPTSRDIARATLHTGSADDGAAT